MTTKSSAVSSSHVRKFLAGAIPTPVKSWLRRWIIGYAAPEASQALDFSAVRDARLRPDGHATQDVKEYYEKMTPAYIAGFGEIFQGSRPESDRALIDYIIEAADIRDGHRILDAGCGVGGPACAIATRRQVSIAGVTIAKTQVVEAHQRIERAGLQDRVAVIEGDFHRMDELFEAGAFDRVLFLESICHAESYEAALRAAYRLLKPGGALYIKDFYALDVSANPSLTAARLVDLSKLNDVYKLRVPDLASLADLLGKVGFVLSYIRAPQYDPTYRQWAAYEQESGNPWSPASGQPGEIIQAVELMYSKSPVG